MMVRGPSFTQRGDVVKFLVASEKMVVGNNPPESMFKDSRKCFLEINISPEVPLAVLITNASNRHQKKTIHVFCVWVKIAVKGNYFEGV